MPRTCIIRIDSVQRYCDIIASQQPSKMIYHELIEKYGHLWANYKAFISWRYHNRKVVPRNTIRGQFLEEYYQLLGEEVKPAEIFEEINQDYDNLWGSYLNFLKSKSMYQKKRIVSV